MIAVTPAPRPKRPPLECEAHVYSTGGRGRVYDVDCFYKAMSSDFGIEVTVRNNTSNAQLVTMGGCVRNGMGNCVWTWRKITQEIWPNSSYKKSFWLPKQKLNALTSGWYRLEFWVNDQKVHSKTFTVQEK